MKKIQDSTETTQEIGVKRVVTIYCADILNHVITNSVDNDFVDLTIEKRGAILETISNQTTWKTHATSSEHKAHKKVVHDNNGDEE